MSSLAELGVTCAPAQRAAPLRRRQPDVAAGVVVGWLQPGDRTPAIVNTGVNREAPS